MYLHIMYGSLQALVGKGSGYLQFKRLNGSITGPTQKPLEPRQRPLDNMLLVERLGPTKGFPHAMQSDLLICLLQLVHLTFYSGLNQPIEVYHFRVCDGKLHSYDWNVQSCVGLYLHFLR